MPSDVDRAADHGTNRTGAGATTRRRFLELSGATSATLAASVSGAAAVAGSLRADEPADAGVKEAATTAQPAEPPPPVHPGGTDEIHVALIGCGGRGGGAAVDALSVPDGGLKVVAMADVFKDRIDIVKRSLVEQFQERIDVPDERGYVGFEAYRQAIDTLRPGDIAICATPAAFRAAHFAACIEKGVHVFMEKPIAVDGPSARRIIDLAGQAEARGLKVGVGLMCRHSSGRLELLDQLRSGVVGDLQTFWGYRMHNPPHNLDLAPGPQGMNELLWQAKRFHNFLWASGGIYSDYFIHHIDEVCWMKDAWPVLAEANGGRHVQGKINDQNFDNYSVEYTFADGAKFFYYGRVIPNCQQKFGVFGQGTKHAFTISGSGHHPARSAIYRGLRIDKKEALWQATQPETNPYRQEWIDLVTAIRAGTPYNEAARGAEASLVTAMGRFAAHTGRAVTFQEMFDCPDDLTVGVELLTDTSAAPLQPDEHGIFPVPMPGRFKYEYRN
jgi:predicted dehydrogenase